MQARPEHLAILKRLKKLEMTESLIRVSDKETKAPAKSSPPRTEEKKLELTTSERDLLVINPRSFQEGDILLFLPPREGLNCGQKMICCAQAFKKRRHGHQEITHAAIFVGYEKVKNKLIPKIADVTSKGFRVGKLKDDQPVLIFRAQDQSLGNFMKKEAMLIHENQHRLHWSCCVALGMLSHRKKSDSERKISDIKISKGTTCSRFVIQIQERALTQLTSPQERKNLDLGVHDMSTPKDLESALHVNNHYDMFISLGKKNQHEGTPYQVIRKEVEVQLKRLKENARKSTNRQVKNKYASASEAFSLAETMLKSSHDMDEIAKAIYLFDRMKPVFAVNTGCGFRNTSASALDASRRTTGLFQSVMDKYKRTLTREHKNVDEKGESKALLPDIKRANSG